MNEPQIYVYTKQRGSCSSVYLNHYDFQHTGRHKIIKCVAGLMCPEKQAQLLHLL
jgi:tryptophan synthase beta subunit